ncbi:baculoviral IAP repeat-containing protein 7-like isoform X3, partial [Leptotrombidium deliense]
MDVTGYKYNIYRLKPNGNIETESKVLFNEKERLRSFFTKNHTFPHHIPSPSSLARAGFHFTGHGDDVTCVFCNGTLTHWTIYDDPIKEHKFWFPSCPFVLGKC